MTDEEFEKLGTDEKFGQLREELKRLVYAMKTSHADLATHIDRLTTRVRNLETASKK